MNQAKNSGALISTPKASIILVRKKSPMTNIKDIPITHDLSGRYGTYPQMKDPAFQASIKKLVKELEKEYGPFGHSYFSRTKTTPPRI